MVPDSKLGESRKLCINGRSYGGRSFTIEGVDVSLPSKHKLVPERDCNTLDRC